MSLTKTTTASIKTDDSKGIVTVEYNTDTNQRLSTIKLTWLGNTISFASVLEYQTYLSQVIIPLTNLLNSSSGSGQGYAAVTNGTAGSDKIVD